MSRAIILCLGLLAASAAGAATFHVAQGQANASDENPGTAAKPWKTLSKAAATLGPGDTVLIHAGVYREQVRPARSGAPGQPIAYEAAQGETAVITGADPVTGWTPAKGAAWKKEPWPYRFDTHPNDARHRLIGRCEQVVADGRLLKQVEKPEELAEGTFCADTDRKALYAWLPGGADPNQRQVEASVRGVCFGLGWGGEARDWLALRGLTIRHAANMAQRGALFAVGNHWLIEDCVVEWTNGNGLSFRGDDVTIRRVRSHHNGQMGMGGGGRRFLLDEVVLDHNNLKGYSKGWEAGGIKVTHGRDGAVRRCQAIANDGVGIWFDIDVRDIAVEGCFCRDNSGHGIFVEISGGFAIRNNLCVHNGLDNNWGEGGIAIGESDHCTIENNTCVLNPTGISIREQGPRTFPGLGGAQVTYHVHDVAIRRNICALNSKYQFGLWWDNVFFGPHPSASVGLRGTPYDPDKQSIQLDENLYWKTGAAKLILWGVPWRPKHQAYDDLAAWQRDRGQGAHSLVADPLFVDPKAGDWGVRPESPALKLRAGPLEKPVSPDPAALR